MRVAGLGISLLVLLGACTSDRQFSSKAGPGGAAGDGADESVGTTSGRSGGGTEPAGGRGGTTASGGTSEASGGTTASGGTSEASGGTTASGGTSEASGGEGPSSGGAGGSGPGCGDGNVDPGEECDDGAGNGTGKACHAGCLRNVCGDGDKGPGEGCDDGNENGLELLRCAPDCSRIIEIKHFVLATTELPNSKLQPNPVATADATCLSGYKAFFAYGTQRRATTTPFKSKNSVDWVLRPYTYYYNDHENPVWLTDSVPLLGVRNGQFTALENQVSDAAIWVILTGLNADYTTLGSDNCNGWSSLQTTDSKRYSLPWLTDVSFLYSADTIECGSYSISFYCVEQ